MNLIQNFFCALSECFCEIFPETLSVYKSLLTLSKSDQELVENKFQQFISEHRHVLVNRDVQNLPEMTFDGVLPSIDLKKIIDHPQGQANADTIWDHIFVIIKFLSPETDLSIAPASQSASDFIENIVSQVTGSIPDLNSDMAPQDIFKSIANSEMLPGLFSQIQSQMNSRPEFSPANLIMAAAQLLLKRPQQ